MNRTRVTDNAVDISTWLDSEIYPFEHRYAEVPAGRLHYVDEGTGAPVVMVHGNPTWSFVYRHLIKHLRGEYRCIVPDHLGFGLSDKPREWSYRPEDHAENLALLLRGLDLDDITLVVQDWGGPIGLSYAIDNPTRVRRLVILNTWMWPLNGDPYYLAYRAFMGGPVGRYLIKRHNFFVRRMMPMLFADAEKLPTHIHRHYLEPLSDRIEREGCWRFAHAVTNSTEWLDFLWSNSDRLHDMDILLVWGSQDIGFRRKELNRWISRFPGATVERVDEAGHFLQEESPDRLNRVVSQFMSEIPRLS